MTYLADLAANKPRAALIKAGVPWQVVDKFAEAARSAHLDRVMRMSLEEFKTEELPGAPPWVKANFGDEDKRAKIESHIYDLLPGQLISLRSLDIYEAYRRVESVDDALFGAQIGPLDWLRELHPDLIVKVDVLGDHIVLSRQDRLGLTTLTPRVVWTESRDSLSLCSPLSESSVCVQTVFMSLGPLSSEECSLLLRLKRTLPADLGRFPLAILESGRDGLQQRGLIGCESSPDGDGLVSLWLTDLGLEFLGVERSEELCVA
jgi:hypothetical protein